MRAASDVRVPCQRWRDRRDSYRPPLERINPAEFDVARVAVADAKAFVVRHHYSGTCSSTRRCFGLFRRGELAGVAVFGHPMAEAVLTNVFGGEARESLELSRFVLLDEVKANGETWFLARCFELLRREDLRGVVSFSDPMPRTSAAGARVFPGHLGGIYQAFNGVYLGRARPSTLRLLADGRVFSHRTETKVRAKASRWQSGVRQLVAAGAPDPGSNPSAADLREWLAAALPLLTRKVRHPGNHRYAWALQRAVRRSLPPSLPYPKRGLAA
jgi:hypothetical protein